MAVDLNRCLAHDLAVRGEQLGLRRADGAASAAASDDVLSDALLTGVATSTASLVGIIAAQVDDIATAISLGQAEGALTDLAKASAASKDASVAP